MEALRDVKHLKVYRKGDNYLVNKLHYSDSDRIAPIIITAAEEGVLIYPNETERDKHTISKIFEILSCYTYRNNTSMENLKWIGPQ